MSRFSKEVKRALYSNYWLMADKVIALVVLASLMIA